MTLEAIPAEATDDAFDFRTLSGNPPKFSKQPIARVSLGKIAPTFCRVAGVNGYYIQTLLQSDSGNRNVQERVL